MATVGTIRGRNIDILPDGRRLIVIDGISYSAEREFARDTILVVADGQTAEGGTFRQHRSFAAGFVDQMDRHGPYEDALAYCLAETIHIDHAQNLKRMPGRRVYTHWADDAYYLNNFAPSVASPIAADVQREAEQADLESNPLYGMF